MIITIYTFTIYYLEYFDNFFIDNIKLLVFNYCFVCIKLIFNVMINHISK